MVLHDEDPTCLPRDSRLQYLADSYCYSSHRFSHHVYIHLSAIYTSAAELWYMLSITTFPFQIQILRIGEHHLLMKLLLIQSD